MIEMIKDFTGKPKMKERHHSVLQNKRALGFSWETKAYITLMFQKL
jgi:hypothetical protein